MCKYCKNLKRIKDLDEKSYLEIIRSWKAHCYRMEKLLRKIQHDLFPSVLYMALFFPDEDEIRSFVAALDHDLNKELQKPWIGK